MPLSSQNSLARRCGSARTPPQAAAPTSAAAASATTARKRPVAAAPTPRLINAAIAPSLGACKPADRPRPPRSNDPRTETSVPPHTSACNRATDANTRPKGLVEPGLVEPGLVEPGLVERLVKPSPGQTRAFGHCRPLAGCWATW